MVASTKSSLDQKKDDEDDDDDETTRNKKRRRRRRRRESFSRTYSWWLTSIEKREREYTGEKFLHSHHHPRLLLLSLVWRAAGTHQRPQWHRERARLRASRSRTWLVHAPCRFLSLSPVPSTTLGDFFLFSYRGAKNRSSLVFFFFFIIIDRCNTMPFSSLPLSFLDARVPRAQQPTKYIRRKRKKIAQARPLFIITYRISKKASSSIQTISFVLSIVVLFSSLLSSVHLDRTRGTALQGTEVSNIVIDVYSHRPMRTSGAV